MIHEVRTSARSFWAGLPVLLFGVFALLAAPAVGCLLLLIGAAIATSYRAVELDIARRRYRNFTWVLGWHAGRWAPLPPTTRVVLKPHSDTIVYAASRRGRFGTDSYISSSGRYEHLTLLLSVPDSIIGEVMEEFTLRQRARAIAVGQRLAEVLGVPLLVLEGV
ncbi:hypothetical protein LJ737_20090 [Hymenobacter sp. 15J16-1T3B]|uniref:hypothetical protein n=1 Tax=Hymenobacter sp. 15J16-1T3B TaxID=2886941 RepID=UPI001D12F50F|nr:hypothetical protein [Hymenobacter sp. 15J16-1T3B]MCC3159553.1 hypothetical protein [Hymenobacter sp. 15J16-1T3B]